MAHKPVVQENQFVPSVKLGSSLLITPVIQIGQLNKQITIPRSSVMKQPVSKSLVIDSSRDLPPSFGKQFVCQVCDKYFLMKHTLNQHMRTHITRSKLSYNCLLCANKYPSQRALENHNDLCHTNTEDSVVIPVVDLNEPDVLQKLSSIGMKDVIPLSQLSSGPGDMFGFPIMATDNKAAIKLGATKMLPIGPLQPI
uniref:C2H2-type domain-containing protein n=1 Tax=Clastoptera arizonana TaxID=38151 RepID=A0A1B6CKP1_9HEMI